MSEETTDIRTARIDPFAVADPKDAASKLEPHVHVMREGIVCETEKRGYETPGGVSLYEIVVDASEGFVPLWAPGKTLRWRFRESSFAHFSNPGAAKTAIEALLAEAILRWGDAAPIKFAKREDAWDFEVVVSKEPNCSPMGCTLARAFFPSGGQHQLIIFPTMFQQSAKEQVETLIHEIGHIFGLRHFFAQVREKAWKSEVFGDHDKFTIMNYGPDSYLTETDKADLKRLYELAWSGKLKEVNGTPIRFMRPHHESGLPAEAMAYA